MSRDDREDTPSTRSSSITKSSIPSGRRRENRLGWNDAVRAELKRNALHTSRKSGRP